MRKYGYLCGLITVLLLFTTACLGQAPAEDKTVSGLTEQVTVRRDSRWIPYIEAKSNADLYFTQGYITASDRLWQMDLYRRLAAGRTAEIFGPPALEQDRRWRRFGFERIVKKAYSDFSAEYRKVLEDYARGVNAYIAELDEDSIPVEFKILRYRPDPWQPTDSLIIGKILADALSTSWHEDVTRQKFTDLPPEKFRQLFIEKNPYDVLLVGKDLDKTESEVKERIRLAAPEENNLSRAADRELRIRKKSLELVGFYEPFSAVSNNWVISGKRTLDGKPILANDPHLQPSVPPIWYLTHLSGPGSRVSGATFPGVPGIVLGHNEYIAWGATNLGPDVQDVYLEDFNENGFYRTADGLKKADLRIERIRYRKSPLSKETAIEKLEVIETSNGVVIQNRGKQKTALRWTALDPQNNEFEAFYLLNRARNWNEFKAALKTYGGATQNFIYADIRGNIGFHNAGAIPIRSSGDGSLPYRGAENQGRWTGYIPFEELPSLFNPPEGFIVTANQRLTGESYPHFLGYAWASPHRARRIYQLLKANKKMTPEDSMDIQTDVFDIAHADFAREIIRLRAAGPETLDLLRGWDGKMLAESRAALLVNEIRNVFTDIILQGNLGREKANQYRWSNSASFTDWLLREKPPGWLPKEYDSYQAVLLEAEKTARENLGKKYGAEPMGWNWGKKRRTKFAHPLSSAPIVGSLFKPVDLPGQGSSQTPNVGVAVSMRHITVPGNWDRTRQGITLGQSGDPASPFWKDELEFWMAGNTRIFPFSEKAVNKAAVKTIHLKSK